MYNEALTIQRLVHDFIMVETGAKDKGYFVAEHGVKYAPFPSPPVHDAYGTLRGIQVRFSSLSKTLL